MKEISLRIPTSDGAMPVFAAMPQDVALAPGVLIYMDVFGPREELDDIARRFASAGYLAVVPQLFHRLRLSHLQLLRAAGVLYGLAAGASAER